MEAKKEVLRIALASLRSTLNYPSQEKTYSPDYILLRSSSSKDKTSLAADPLAHVDTIDTKNNVSAPNVSSPKGPFVYAESATCGDGFTEWIEPSTDDNKTKHSADLVECFYV